MNQVPLLIISDSPEQSSGLARVTRDLATLLVSMSEFRVATLGAYGTGSSRLPWSQYHIRPDTWGERDLPLVWDEFSQGAPGIVFTIFDLSRLMWIARPEFVEDEALRGWLLHARRHKIRLWSYVPVDSTGPHDRLTTYSREVLMGMDRVLTFSPWAMEVVRNTLGQEEAERRGLDWLPHACNTRTFTPNVHMIDGGKRTDGVKRIGIVMTNQSRKDWAAASVICATLAERLKGQVTFWFHTDARVRYWNLDALISDFNLGELVELTFPPISDREMAERYRSCDLTLLPSLGEGVGYPWIESVACGVPCLHVDYAGGASIMKTCGLESLLIEPAQWRLDGQYNCLRPVIEPRDWVERAIHLLANPLDRQALARTVEHLDMRKLGYIWKRWFREGL